MATPINGTKVRGTWDDLACDSSVVINTGNLSGAERNALRVRTNAPFCIDDLTRFDVFNNESRRVARTHASTRQNCVDVK